MRQADVPFGEAEFGSEFRSGSVQVQDRTLARGVHADFNLLPAHISDAGSECFGDSFFGCQTRRQSIGLVLAVAALAGGEEAVEEVSSTAIDSIARSFLRLWEIVGEGRVRFGGGVGLV